jgi:hypothetical protein
MNIRQVIDASSGREVKSFSTESPQADVKAEAQHNAWLLNPETQEFLRFLTREVAHLQSISIENACSGGNPHTITKPLIKAKAILEVIDYARTKRRNTSNRDTSTNSGD